MLELLKQPWHWSVAGVIIGLFVPLLLIVGNKTFGISSSMRHICAAIFPANISYFKYNWKAESWNLVFVAGVLIGGWVGAHVFKNPEPIAIADSTKSYLQSIGIQEFGALVPTDLFSWENLFTFRGFIFIVFGGFLVGFGTRYAGGCTSGHSIMGLSNLQLPSLIATICFMAGGSIVTWLVIPYL
ncbi:YeeE/YedE family protein [Emticicia agri]|uniref:YeeE/YedE family protein n=1 Tax=Emticicia agri TaxID=2492393 RepID=A0A4Q5M1E4_9BACT|nr:YeeE/YedE thiosulfate transporter family protein [Emticicia agri]RYU95829.1 YeeE/YedE family protein [Emticicia agri]